MSSPPSMKKSFSKEKKGKWYGVPELAWSPAPTQRQTRRDRAKIFLTQYRCVFHHRLHRQKELRRPLRLSISQTFNPEVRAIVPGVQYLSFAPHEIIGDLKKEVGFLVFLLLLRSDHPLPLSGRTCRKDNSEVDSRKGPQDVLTRSLSQRGASRVCQKILALSLRDRVQISAKITRKDGGRQAVLTKSLPFSGKGAWCPSKQLSSVPTRYPRKDHERGSPPWMNVPFNALCISLCNSWVYRTG